MKWKYQCRKHPFNKKSTMLQDIIKLLLLSHPVQCFTFIDLGKLLKKKLMKATGIIG